MAIISDGTTIADAGAVGGLGSLVLIKTITLSSAASTVSFVDGASSVVFDDTYPLYKIEYINIHMAAHNANQPGGLNFNVSVDTGSNYNVAKTSTAFTAYHNESGSSGGVGYNVSNDAAQVTGAIPLSGQIMTDNDASISGEVYFFNPSSTVFTKHFMSSNQRMDKSADPRYSNMYKVAGYANTTSAVDAVQFTSWSGNIDSGVFKLYGIKDS